MSVRLFNIFLPQEISRNIYLNWYFPTVVEEIKKNVSRIDFYTVQTHTEDNEQTDITLIIFKLSSGKFTRMIAQTRTILRLNRTDRLKKILGWPFTIDI